MSRDKESKSENRRPYRKTPSYKKLSSGGSSLPQNRRVSEDYFGGFIEVAERRGTAFIRVSGLGTLQNGAPLRLYLQEAQEKGITEFFIDLGSCQGMDSTFMGLIGGLAMDMSETSGGMAILLNVGDYNHHLLHQLGVLELIDEGETSIPDDLEWERLNPSDATALDRAKLAYDAHQRLVQIHPANKARFLSFLKRLGKELFPFFKHTDENADGK